MLAGPLSRPHFPYWRSSAKGGTRTLPFSDYHILLWASESHTLLMLVNILFGDVPIHSITSFFFFFTNDGYQNIMVLRSINNTVCLAAGLLTFRLQLWTEIKLLLVKQGPHWNLGWLWEEKLPLWWVSHGDGWFSKITHNNVYVQKQGLIDPNQMPYREEKALLKLTQKPYAKKRSYFAWHVVVQTFLKKLKHT